MQSRIPTGTSTTTATEKKSKPKLQKLTRANSESNTAILKTTTTTTNNNTKVSFNASSIPTSNITTSSMNNGVGGEVTKERRSSTGGIRSLRNKFQALSGGGSKKSPPASKAIPLPTSTIKSRIASAEFTVPTSTTVTGASTTSKGPGPMIWKEGSGWGGSNMVRGWSDPTSTRSSYSDREDLGVVPNGHRPSLDSIIIANSITSSNLKQPDYTRSGSLTPSSISTINSLQQQPIASTSNLATSPTSSRTPIGQASSTSPWARNYSLSSASVAAATTTSNSSPPASIPTLLAPRRFSKDFERPSNEPSLSQLRSNSLGINGVSGAVGGTGGNHLAYLRRISPTTKKPVPPPEIPLRAVSRSISENSFNLNSNNGNGNGNGVIVSESGTGIASTSNVNGPSRFGYTRRGSPPNNQSPTSATTPSSTLGNGTPPTPRSALDSMKKDDLAYRRLSLMSANNSNSTTTTPQASGSGLGSTERKTSYRLSVTPSILLEHESIYSPSSNIYSLTPSTSTYSRVEKGKGPELVKNRIAMYQKDANTEWTKSSNSSSKNRTSNVSHGYRSNSMTSEGGSNRFLVGGGLYRGMNAEALGTAVVGGSLRKRDTQWMAPSPTEQPVLESSLFGRVPEEKKEELEKEEDVTVEEEEIGVTMDSNKSEGRSLRSNSTTPDQNLKVNNTELGWPFSLQQRSKLPLTSSESINSISSIDPILITEEREEIYSRPDSNMSRNTFGSPGGPQVFTTPPPSPFPPPPPPPIKINSAIPSSTLSSKPILMTPPRSLKRSQSADSDISAKFNALGKKKKEGKEEKGGEVEEEDVNGISRSNTITPATTNSHSSSSKFLQRKAIEGRKWGAGGSRISQRRGSEKSLRPRDSMSPVGGWSSEYLEEAEDDAKVISSRVDWKNLNPSAERFNYEEEHRKEVKRLSRLDFEDGFDGLEERRASEGTLRLEDSMVGYYARDDDDDEEEEEVQEDKRGQDYSNSLSGLVFQPTTTVTTISPNIHHIKSFSAPVLDSDVPQGYGRALSVEEMEAEIERMENELSTSRSNRRLLSTFDTSSSLAASSNDLARSSTSSNDTANLFSSSSASSAPFTPHTSYLNRRTLTSSYSSSNIPDSPESEQDLTPQTARRWSIVEVELAYERMKGMLGSTRSLAISERASDEDIAGAYERALKDAQRDRDSSDSRSINGFRDSKRDSSSELGWGNHSIGDRSRDLGEMETSGVSPIVERSDSISSSTSTLLVNNQFRPRSFSPTPTTSPYSGRRHTEEDGTLRSPSLNYKNSPTMVRRSPSSRSLNILLHRKSNSVRGDNLFDPISYQNQPTSSPRLECSLSPTSKSQELESNLLRRESIETRTSSTSKSSTVSGNSKVGGVRGFRIPLVRNGTRDSSISTTYDTASEGGFWTPSINGASSPTESNSTRRGSTIPNDWNIVTSIEGDRYLERLLPKEEEGEGTNWIAEQSSVTIRQDYDQRFNDNSSGASESPFDRFLYQKSPKSIPPRLSNSSLLSREGGAIPDSPTMDFLNTFNDEIEVEDEDEDDEKSIIILISDKSNASRSPRERQEREIVVVNTSTPRKSSATGSNSSSNSGDGNKTNSSIRLEDIRGMNESELFTKFTLLETDLQKAEMERDAYLYALERSKKGATSATIVQDPKEIELTVQREKNFSQILGSEPEAQVKKLREIVSERDQALEELETAKEAAKVLKKALLQGLSREEDLERESVTLGAKLVAFAAQHGVLTPDLSYAPHSGYTFPSTPSTQTSTSTLKAGPRQFRSPPKNPLRPVSRSFTLNAPLPPLPPTSNPTTPTTLNFPDSPVTLASTSSTTNSTSDSPFTRLAEAIKVENSTISSSTTTPQIPTSLASSITGSESDLSGLSSPLLSQTPPVGALDSSIGSTSTSTSMKLKFGRGPPPPQLLTRPSYSRRNVSEVSTTSTTDSREYSALDRRPGFDNRKESNFLSDLTADF